jgi:hypothetical protein
LRKTGLGFTIEYPQDLTGFSRRLAETGWLENKDRLWTASMETCQVCRRLAETGWMENKDGLWAASMET